MKGRLLQGMLAVIGLSLCGLLMGTAATSDTAPPPPGKTTFYKDVLPILQNNCQSCHRSGEVAPMSLMTYDETRPFAIAIKMAILTQKMPPWFADPQYGHFSNQRKLTPQEIRTLVTWVDGGAQPGDSKDAPPPAKFIDGWNIGKPDRVIEMPAEFHVPSEGTVDYQYVVIPGGFTQDTWVTAAEVRPGNRAVVHHVIAFVRPPDSPWMKEAKAGEFFVPKREANPEGGQRQGGQGQQQGDQAQQRPARRGNITDNELLVGYAPGLQPLQLNPGEAKLIKAGSDIVLQLHYTANGTAGMDKTRIGLIYAKEPPKIRSVQLASSNPGFKIPPNNDNYEVKSQVQLEDTVTLADLMPHMHFRGKDFKYDIIYPDGKTETLLWVPKYDFNWQLGYRLAQPMVLPKGTRIECTAHFDNSANNPYNPDPTKEVKWGDQTWEEMMIGWFSVSVDPKANIAGLVKFEKPGTRTPPGQPDAKQPDTKPTDSKPAGAAAGGASPSSTQQ